LQENRSAGVSRQGSSWILPLLAGLGVVEGLAVFAFLLQLPTDPDTRAVAGYSVTRLIMLAGAGLGVALFAAFLVKALRNRPWAGMLAERLFRDPRTVPTGLLAIAILAIGVAGAVILLLPRAVLSLTSDHMLRLWPFVGWGGLLAGQLGAAWLWVFRRKSLAPSAHGAEALALVALYGVSLAVRVPLTGYGLPYQGMWDEVVTYPQAMRMLTVPGLKPISNVPGYGKTAYGDLLVYVTAAGEVIGLIDGLRTQKVASMEEYVAPPQGVHSIYEAVHVSGIPLRYPRLLLVAINSLAPLAIFLILRKHFHVGTWLAFGAALPYSLLSIDVVFNSSFIFPDALATTLLLFCLMAAFEGMADDSGRLAPWAACGALAGMSASVTIRAVTVSFIPFAAFALARRHDRPFAKLVTLALALFAGFALTSPYALLDLPAYLAKITAFSWNHELTDTHRLSSLVFYFRGAFATGFFSKLLPSMPGSDGLGALVGLLALPGLVRGTVRFPRILIPIVAFFLLHLYTILPVMGRYTRHALVLYPLVCILAGNGLALLSDELVRWLGRIQAGRFAAWQRVAPGVVLLLFLALSWSQARGMVRYVSDTSRAKPSQVQAAEYLEGVLQPGDNVGILDQIPWVEEDLWRRAIEFERVSFTDTLADLRANKINFVVGTDRFGGDYSSLSGRLWEDRFNMAGLKLAEFGDAPLQYQGYPNANLYLFVARVPGP